MEDSVSAHPWNLFRLCHFSAKNIFSLWTNNLTYQRGPIRAFICDKLKSFMVLYCSFYHLSQRHRHNSANPASLTQVEFRCWFFVEKFDAFRSVTIKKQKKAWQQFIRMLLQSQKIFLSSYHVYLSLFIPLVLRCGLALILGTYRPRGPWFSSCFNFFIETGNLILNVSIFKTLMNWIKTRVLAYISPIWT